MQQQPVSFCVPPFLPCHPGCLSSFCRHYTLTPHLHQHPNSLCTILLVATHLFPKGVPLIALPVQTRLLWTLAHHLWLTCTTVISWLLGDCWSALACKIQPIPLPFSRLQSSRSEPQFSGGNSSKFVLVYPLLVP